MGKALIGQLDSIVEYISKDTPLDFPASLRESAAVDRCDFRPKAASLGISEELSRFHIYSFGPSAGDNGENEGNELWKRELTVSGKIFG